MREGGRRALCQLDPMDYIFLNVFTERVGNQRISASKEGVKKKKHNKSCENLWSKCWCCEC